jgi:4,5-DOPA dioxygenase extradiol
MDDACSAAVGFVSHGAPTLATDAEKGADLARWAAGLGRPTAVLVVSAHWERTPVVVGTSHRRELLYDFSGFPAELYELEYPAPGAGALADDVARRIGAERSDLRPWDHGVWVPLLHMYPAADVPVLQVSLPSRSSARELFDVGARLAPLAGEGVLVLASGGMVHNLGELDWTDRADPPGWALAFESWTRDALSRWDVDLLLDFRAKAPDVERAHPTLEHFLPLLAAVGAASARRGDVHYPVEGFEYGSLSRLAVQFG